ncbi:MAG: riboflavin synthase [Eubacteriaceae bacterium]|nr:riboflavin synthase [Eubacteriaceae bacterium]
MFTGLIEESGKILDIKRGALSARVTIQGNKVLENVRKGDSIAVNGICLTVTDFTNQNFSVDVMPETIRMSSLGSAQRGSKVNLERALRLGDRMGGHIVSGHIDGTGIVIASQREDNAVRIKIEAKPEIMKYIIAKGSIALDGVSLTVADISDTWFEVSIIPLTGEETNLLGKKSGDRINIECDQIGKYIERLMQFGKDQPGNSSKRGIDLEFLLENGF